MFKFLTPEQLYEIFLANVKDISWMTTEVKKDLVKSLEAVYTQGLKDATTLHKGEKT